MEPTRDVLSIARVVLKPVLYAAILILFLTHIAAWPLAEAVQRRTGWVLMRTLALTSPVVFTPAMLVAVALLRRKFASRYGGRAFQLGIVLTVCATAFLLLALVRDAAAASPAPSPVTLAAALVLAGNWAFWLRLVTRIGTHR